MFNYACLDFRFMNPNQICTHTLVYSHTVHLKGAVCVSPNGYSLANLIQEIKLGNYWNCVTLFLLCLSNTNT